MPTPTRNPLFASNFKAPSAFLNIFWLSPALSVVVDDRMESNWNNNSHHEHIEIERF
jgi:hypothetical protein